MLRFSNWIVSVGITVGSLGCNATAIDEGGSGGNGTGDDGPATNAATATSAIQATSAGTGNGGPCGGVVPLATPEALAKTPRADVDAEILAVEASGAFVATDALYARVHEELKAIRALAPETADVSPRSTIVPASIFMQLDEDAAAALAAGEDTPVACLSALYGAESLDQKNEPALPDTVYADYGAKVIDSVALAEQYQRLKGVISARPTGNEVDGPDVCLHAEGDAHIYIFDHAGGDCPAGCTEHLFSGFRVLPGEAPERLGDFDPYLDADPTWFRSATRCSNLL